MPGNAQISQEIAEVLAPNVGGNAKVSQQIAEVVTSNASGNAMVSQAIIEIISPANPPLVVDQVAMEVFISPPLGTSAIVDQVGLEIFASLYIPSPPPVTAQNMGLWFDFNKLDESGLPTAGEINGMNVAGAVALRGPNDDGNVAWTDSTVNRVGRFGQGFSDFGAPINAIVYGLGDFFGEEFGPAAPLQIKFIQAAALLAAIPLISVAQTVNFTLTIVTDLLNATKAATQPITTNVASGGGTWGQPWGSMIWSAGATQSAYYVAQVMGQLPMGGHIIQLGIQESSVYPWTIMGYAYELNGQREAR